MGIEGWTNDAILVELGHRLRTERLNRNLTMEAVAARAGVSPKTLHNVEDGDNHSVTTLLRVLRALGLLGRMDALVPEPGISPVELAKLHGKPRRRATGRRARGGDDDSWQW